MEFHIISHIEGHTEANFSSNFFPFVIFLLNLAWKRMDYMYKVLTSWWFLFLRKWTFQIGRKKKAAKQILSDFSVHEAENLRKFGNSYKI